MKNTLILILFITSTFCFGQKLSEIKKENTFFILYEEGDYASEVIDSINYKNPEEYTHYYSYYEDKNKNFQSKFPFFFSYAKYRKHSHFLNKTNQTKEYKINKKFLKRNKDIIITKEFIAEIGVTKAIDLFYGNNKYFFLIDKSDMKNGKILVREVNFFYESPH